ncbi:MAG TPA: ScpA family protein [Actinomycetota bacterium]|nr:ScpA family protein [Actinomycetota bacterium]
MAYEVKLDVFEGPIDLLLHLITRQRVDIYEISLSTITEEYIAAIERLDELDLETATGFLIVAATLLELKSSRLLPGRYTEDPSLLEERDLLLARLVECATFRAAGEWLATMLERGLDWHPRTAGLEPEFAGLAPDLLASTTPEHLARAAAAAFAPKPTPEIDLHHITPIRETVRDAIYELAQVLDGRSGAVSFSELCGGTTRRIEVVVRFLALLELFKSGAVDVAQADRFGDIRATWTGEVDFDEVLEEADEYMLAPTQPGGARS